MTSRSFGKLTFATCRTQSGRCQVAFDASVRGAEASLARFDRLVDLGDFVGLDGRHLHRRRRASPRSGRPTGRSSRRRSARCPRSGTASSDKEVSLPRAPPRPAREPGDARALPAAHAGRPGAARLPRRRTASRRSRRPSSRRRPRARSRGRSSRTTTRSDIECALRIAPETWLKKLRRGRHRPGLRGGAVLPQRGHGPLAPPGLHDGRVVLRLLRLPRQHGLHAGAAPAPARRGRGLAHDPLGRARDRLHAPLAARAHARPDPARLRDRLRPPPRRPVPPPRRSPRRASSSSATTSTCSGAGR